jgi:hypothetical protein
MLFFGILVVMFAAIFDVIGKNENEDFRHVGAYTGGILWTLRLSLGDFGFGVLEGKKLNTREHFLFWIVWFVAVVLSSLVFLNFIIAEVSNSYTVVKENVDALIYKERAGLIDEAEDLLPESRKQSDKNKFPKYIVSRD